MKPAYCIARFAGKVLFRLDGKGRKQASRNLDIIFQDQKLPVYKKNAIIKNLYIHIASYMVEFLKIGSLTSENYQNFGVLEGFENIDKGLSYGKGIIVVSAHLGNWDYLGSIPVKLGKKASAIINRQSNPYTDKWLKDIRENEGKITCYYNEISDLKKIVKSLKDGGIVSSVADQTYYFKPVFVPFFGISCATADGPAQLHLKYNSPILFAVSYKREDGKYVFRYEEPFFFKETGNYKNDCEKIMAWVNQKYEFFIRKYPDQWFTLLSPRWEMTKPEDFENIVYDPY